MSIFIVQRPALPLKKDENETGVSPMILEPWSVRYYEGNTEEENNGYVVFKLNIHGSARKNGGG